MRKLIVVLSVLALMGGYAIAQDATLATPLVRASEAKYVVTLFTVSQFTANIEAAVQDASGNEIRRVTFVVPDAAHPSATVAGVLTALDTARSGETGGVLRRANLRLLGFLSDNGYLIATLNP